MNHTDVRNEAEIIRELKNGSKIAFGKIYEMYFKRLYGYSLKFTKNSEDAEEIVHDVFLRLWNMRSEIRQEESVRSLLFIISKNYLIKSYYKQINLQIFEDYVDYEEKLRNDCHTDSNIQYEDYLNMIQSEMNKLPETQKNVIELSIFKQFSIKEVSERLSLSKQTVRNQLSLGLKSLRMLVDKTSLLLIIIKYLFN